MLAHSQPDGPPTPLILCVSSVLEGRGNPVCGARLRWAADGPIVGVPQGVRGSAIATEEGDVRRLPGMWPRDHAPLRGPAAGGALQWAARLGAGLLIAVLAGLVLQSSAGAQSPPSAPGGSATFSPGSPEVTSSGIGDVQIRWSASCPNPSGGTSHYWYVASNAYHQDGTHANYVSTAETGVTSDAKTHGLVLEMAPGLQQETFRIEVTLTCYPAAPTVIGSDSLTLTRSRACDPTLFAKAQREFDTAKSFYAAGSKELGDAADGIRTFRNDYIKESLEIGAEKLTALDILKSLSEHLFEAAEATGLWVGIGVTIEELAFKIIPLARDSGKLADEAHADFQRGDAWAARAEADLQAALAGGPCLGPIESQESKLLEEQKLADEARTEIERWNNNGHLYESKINGELLTEDAALKQARAALVSRRATPRGATALRARPRRVRATAHQVRAALRHLEDALKVHRRAATQLARVDTAGGRAETRLNRLLERWPH